MNTKMRKGTIEVICGPMFAGKTEELIRRTKRLEFAKKKYLIFKPSIDNRYSLDEVVSHSNRKLKAINIDVKNPDQLKKFLTSDLSAIVIDEAQFFDVSLVGLVDELAGSGLRIICAGLDLDFRGKPFGIMPQLLALADNVTKLTAICVRCGNDATRTQRIIDGEPAYEDDAVVQIGATEAYEPRCRCCHEVRQRG